MNVGAPISRGFVTDVRQIVILLHPNKPMAEIELASILRNEFGWDKERFDRALNKAQADNEIRWVAFQGWMRGGRPD